LIASIFSPIWSIKYHHFTIRRIRSDLDQPGMGSISSSRLSMSLARLA
jgi:hypothetical protein